MTTVIDDRTPHLNLPLPNKDNDLEHDLPRLRDALTTIDSSIAESSSAVTLAQAAADEAAVLALALGN